jgi:hypothetical protein
VHHHKSNSSKTGHSSKGGALLSNLARDVKALNSSVLIISQKMKYLVRNEKILGRNLLVINKKLKSVQQEEGGGMSEEQLAELKNELANLSASIDKNSSSIVDLESSIDSMKEGYAKEETIKEMKYVIDSINPLKFVTIEDVEKIVDEKIGKAKKPKKPEK